MKSQKISFFRVRPYYEFRNKYRHVWGFGDSGRMRIVGVEGMLA